MNNNKGITLVALVVTIIVLLILVSVSINLTLGENGIITRAKQARDVTKDKSEEERLALESLESEFDNGFEDEKIEGMIKGEYLLTSDGNVYYLDDIERNSFVDFQKPIYTGIKYIDFIVENDNGFYSLVTKQGKVKLIVDNNENEFLVEDIIEKAIFCLDGEFMLSEEGELLYASSYNNIENVISGVKDIQIYSGSSGNILVVLDNDGKIYEIDGEGLDCLNEETDDFLYGVKVRKIKEHLVIGENNKLYDLYWKNCISDLNNDIQGKNFVGFGDSLVAIDTDGNMYVEGSQRYFDVEQILDGNKAFFYSYYGILDSVGIFYEYNTHTAQFNKLEGNRIIECMSGENKFVIINDAGKVRCSEFFPG